MCSNFIKEQDRPTPNLFGHKVCMRQNDTKEKRLLLSRRTAGRWLPFAKMLDCKVAPMRAGKRAASRGIARSSLRKFIDKMRLTDSFTLLSGKSESIREVAAALGINYKKLDNGEYSHSSLFTLLSPSGEIILQHPGLSVSVENFKAKIEP